MVVLKKMKVILSNPPPSGVRFVETPWRLPVSDRTDRNAATRSTKMGKIYQVVVNGFRGEKVILDLCNTEEQMQSMTVLQLKEKIEQKLALTGGTRTSVACVLKYGLLRLLSVFPVEILQ